MHIWIYAYVYTELCSYKSARKNTQLFVQVKPYTIADIPWNRIGSFPVGNYLNFISLLLFQHPFIKAFTDKKPILNLLSEAKAEVEETVLEMDDEEDIKSIKVHNRHFSFYNNSFLKKFHFFLFFLHAFCCLSLVCYFFINFFPLMYIRFLSLLVFYFIHCPFSLQPLPYFACSLFYSFSLFSL